MLKVVYISNADTISDVIEKTGTVSNADAVNLVSITVELKEILEMIEEDLLKMMYDFQSFMMPQLAYVEEPLLKQSQCIGGFPPHFLRQKRMCPTSGFRGIKGRKFRN